MSTGERSSPLRRWPDRLRWAACFVLVLGLHATAAATLLRHWQPPDEPVEGGPAILIDLAPVAAAPEAPASEAAPGPQQVQTPPEPQPEPETRPGPEPEKPRVAVIEPPKETPPVEQVETPAPPVESPPVPETPPMIADVVLPPPRPPEPRVKQEPKHQRRLADLNSAPPKLEHTAPHAVAPAPGAAAHDPNAVPHWKTELVARLQRYKRYPSEAQARGEQGVAQLAFSVDRSGGVHDARIVRSSGSSALDRATLDLIARAAPLPAPPPEMRGAQIAITVPINYNLRR
jgi:protein TonB